MPSKRDLVRILSYLYRLRKFRLVKAASFEEHMPKPRVADHTHGNGMICFRCT